MFSRTLWHYQIHQIPHQQPSIVSDLAASALPDISRMDTDTADCFSLQSRPAFRVETTGTDNGDG